MPRLFEFSTFHCCSSSSCVLHGYLVFISIIWYLCLNCIYFQIVSVLQLSIVVLELSEKYQKRFGPLRYFVAGFLKFMCLPKYSFEVEYLPAQKEATGEGKGLVEREVIDMSELYTDIMRRSSKEGLPRASSLSSIDSIMTPSRMSAADLDTTCSSTEPSEYVRAIDAKSKRLSAGRSGNTTYEPEVIHPQLPLSATPNWPRTRSKSRTDKGWSGLTATNDPTRSSWANTTTNDKEDISSTMSDPGPIWETEPRWDTEPHWNMENPIELPGPADETEDAVRKDIVQKSAEEWVTTKGQFLGVLVCNHSCKTVQSLSSQVVAPKAEPDDNTLDLLLVHGSGRLKLIRFFLRLQMGRHLSLPYVEYVKVKQQMDFGCKILFFFLLRQRVFECINTGFPVYMEAITVWIFSKHQST